SFWRCGGGCSPVKRILQVTMVVSLVALGAWSVAQEIAGVGTGSATPVFKLPDLDLSDEGRYIYEQHCIVCHNGNGGGRGEMAAETGVKPRSFRTGLFKARSTPTGKLPT